MAIYTCEICGYVYDEDVEETRWEALGDDWKCPLCTAPKNCFKKEDTTAKTDAAAETQETAAPAEEGGLAIRNSFSRKEDTIEKSMELIHEMAINGKSRIEAMCTRLPVVGFDDILLLGGQLAHPPLADKAEVDTTTIIGRSARKPMVLEHAVYISHMSFGALSKEAKTAMAMGSAAVHTAQCSGEGGILPEERDHAYKYIFEYVPNKYSVNDENLKNADAVEIKIGQGSKPGMGGHLPGEKVTEEIAAIRNKPLGVDVISPSRFEEIKTKDDLKALVDELRLRSDGRPVGIKIAAGRIEDDLEWIHYAQPDFITIDGRGGATGASPKYLKDNSTVPTVYALARARAYMDAHDMKQELVITGGFRTSGEMIKALAMGADAVAVATAAMIAAGCQQYRVCNNGNCPMGIATQDPELRKRLHIEKSAQRITNYLNTLREELKSFARVTGHTSIHDLSKDDLCTTDEDIARYTGITHC